MPDSAESVLILRLCQIRWSIFWITSEISYNHRPQWYYVIRNTDVPCAALFPHSETDLYIISALSPYFKFRQFPILLSQNCFTVVSVLHVQGYGSLFIFCVHIFALNATSCGICLDIQIYCHTFLSFLSTSDLRTSVYEAAIFLLRVRTQNPLAVVIFHRLLWGCKLWR